MLRPLPVGDFAANRLQVAGDGLDQRGLALAVGAEDADALAGHHRAVDAADDDGRRRAGRRSAAGG